jgi:outer membrane protein assembly factor BamB
MVLMARFIQLTILALLLQPVFAQDWNQWRGANRDGQIQGFVAPKTWPEKLQQKWKVNVGIGHASPVVVGKRVYLHARQDEREVALCLDLETGKTLWQDAYAAAYTMNPAATGHGKGPKSTPVVSNGKLYTLGITGVLSCYDAASGKLRWRKEFSKRFKETAPDFGTAMSPMVYQGLLLAHVGGSNSGGFIAFDAETGAEKWAWTSDGPGYASPIMVDLVGKRQVITQSQKHIVSLWADNGYPLWTMPFETAYVQNIVTPMQWKDLLIFSGIGKGVFAVRPAWRNNTWATDKVWHNNDVSMYMNSPLISGDLLFGLSHKQKGQFFCLDLNTGKTLWTGDGRQGENAAMVMAGNVLFSLTNDADLIVSTVSSKGPSVIKRYHVADSPTWAHPVIVGNRILIKDEKTLALWVMP